MKRSLDNESEESDAPPQKRLHMVYKTTEITNSSFANDVSHCDVVFCIPSSEGIGDEAMDDIDVKTNGMNPCGIRFWGLTAPSLLC